MTIRGQQRRPRVVPITAPSFPTLPRPPIYRKIAYTFIALTVVVLVAVLWLSSVRATVIVHVKREAATLDTTVGVAKTPASGQIPGRVFQGTFEKIQEFSVQDLLASVSASTSVNPVTPPSVQTTSTSVSDENVQAQGTVRIINKYSKTQTLVKTTRLLTADGKLYRIDKTVTVPSGGEVSVSAHADKLGQEFVIGPTRFTIPGLFVDLQKYIYAVSDAPFVAVPVAGTPTPAPAPTSTTKPKSGSLVTPEVIAQAYQLLTDQVLAQAKKSLTAEVTDPKFDASVYAIKLVDQKTNVSPGDSADTLIASVKLDVTGAFYSKDDMLAFVRAKLQEKIPEGREPVPFDENDVNETLDLSDAKAETATVHIMAQSAYRLDSTSPALQKSIIAGKSVDEAVNLLKAVQGVQDVEITIHPGWVKKVPSLKDHIDLQIQ